MNRVSRQAIVASAVVAVVAVLARTGVLGGFARGVVMNVTVPVLDVLASPFRAVESGWTVLAGNRRLIRDHRALEARIEDLERQCQEHRELEARCRQLETLVALQQQYPELVPARVVLKDDLGCFKTIVINRGTRDKLTVNMAVVAGAGLVGKIIETGCAYSRVLLVIDKSFKAGARLHQSRITGLIEGGGANEVVLNYLPRDAVVNEGEKVITSGMGGVFPAGYLIGTARKTMLEELSFYQCVRIEPAVNFNVLETVAVIRQLPPEIDVTDARGVELEK